MIEQIIARSIGRNPDNPSDRTAGIPTEQRLEIKLGGITNTVTTVQKDNLVLERKITMDNEVENRQTPIFAEEGGNQNVASKKEDEMNTEYRIRKLTPRECWRLMAFSNEDFERAERVNSNTQLYKQAGNSIVVAVLEAIFRQMLQPNFFNNDIQSDEQK